MFLEVPVFGNGFHIHESKCASCYQNPIIGIYFSCSTCKSLNLCTYFITQVKNAISNVQPPLSTVWCVVINQTISYRWYSSHKSKKANVMNVSIARGRYWSNAGCVRIVTIFSSALNVMTTGMSSRVCMPIPIKNFTCWLKYFDDVFWFFLEKL